MPQMKVFRVDTLPTTLVPHAIYFVKDGTDHYTQVLVNADGTTTRKAFADVKTIAFNRYSLPIATSTGTLDLSMNQVFRVTPGSGSNIALAFANPPGSESMVVVVEIVGNAGAVTLPANVTVVDGVDPAVGVVRTIMTFFYNGTSYYLINASKINA